MGMNSIKFGNSSLEDTKSPMGLPFDPKLLGKLKNFLPGKNHAKKASIFLRKKCTLQKTDSEFELTVLHFRSEC